MVQHSCTTIQGTWVTHVKVNYSVQITEHIMIVTWPKTTSQTLICHWTAVSFDNCHCFDITTFLFIQNCIIFLWDLISRTGKSTSCTFLRPSKRVRPGLWGGQFMCKSEPLIHHLSLMNSGIVTIEYDCTFMEENIYWWNNLVIQCIHVTIWIHFITMSWDLTN